MKQELRRTLDTLGQNNEAVTSFILPRATEAEVTLMPLRRGRREHLSPTPLVARDTSDRGRETQERIEQRAYHWWDDYQSQRWLFEPPEYLKAAYQCKPGEPDAPDSKARFPD